MRGYIVTFLVYVLSFPLFHYFLNDLTVSLAYKLALTGLCLYYFRKDFKFRMRFDLIAIALGVVIFLQWVLLDGLYPHIAPHAIYNYRYIDVILKLMTGVVIAPVIEEFFTRSFLMRYIISKDWKKVAIGKFTPLSFVITVLFFGFSHSRWVAGLITGIILNLLLYKRKNMNSVVLAHAVANLALGIFVIYTGRFEFW